MPTDVNVLAPPERNRYFYGLMMDAERFQRDQDYFNRKRLLLNRFVTGGGVVCGLGLTLNPPSGGATASTLTLSPGLAIDLAGREIVVPKNTPVNITQLTDSHGKPTGPVTAGSTILISLAYAEKKIDDVPVLVPDCSNPGRCAPSAVEEGFAILVTVAPASVPSIPGCVFGMFPVTPAALQAAIAQQIAGSFTAAPADASIPLGRLTLPNGPLDAVSDRPIVYNNALLYQLFTCLADEVAASSSVALTYVSGDNQNAFAGDALPDPIVVGFFDASGNPVISASAPTFTVTAGLGSVGVAAAAGPGQYQATWTLGTAPGPQTVVASSAQSSLTVTFNATTTT